MDRIAKVERRTYETQIDVEVNLDGVGKSEISTGIGFFDHMLEQFAKHGGFDITINCLGDLQIDQHHTIEDVAIALGEAFKAAIGDRNSIERYSSIESFFLS